MKALILVDIQNDFLPGGALAVPDGDDVVPVANHIQALFELVVATQESRGPVLASTSAGASLRLTVAASGLR